MSLDIGYIHIDYQIQDDGEITMHLDVDGDLPVVTQLGLLELAKDTVLNQDPEEEEYDGE